MELQKPEKGEIMGNYWMIPRNKRKLHPVVDVLSLFTLSSTGIPWNGLAEQRSFEDALEGFGLKRAGARRDMLAGGARTYESWLNNLGLIFKETRTGLLRTTLAGDTLLSGEPPVPIITNQLMKMQYPSPYSRRTNVSIDNRFRIRPFRFLLRLLLDTRINQLTKKEIAYFAVTLGSNESNDCFEDVVQAICDYRTYGVSSLPHNMDVLYPSRTGVKSIPETLKRLEDVANTFINYLQYTQLIARVKETGEPEFITIPSHLRDEVSSILNDGSSVRNLDSTHEFGAENFQRSFGLAPGQNRDNRSFSTQPVSVTAYRDRRVRGEVLHIYSRRPVVNINADLIDEVASLTGYTNLEVEEALHGFSPNPVSQFEANYLDMSVSGRARATEFEIATKEIFEALGFAGQHTGMYPRHPDVFVESPQGYSGILDTKAIKRYSPSNDEKNRMISNYIPTYRTQHANLEFFMYIADSFGINYVNGIQDITLASNLDGSGITAYNLLRLLNNHLNNPISHTDLKVLLRSNTAISVTDIDAL